MITQITTVEITQISEEDAHSLEVNRLRSSMGYDDVKVVKEQTFEDDTHHPSYLVAMMEGAVRMHDDEAVLKYVKLLKKEMERC